MLFRRRDGIFVPSDYRDVLPVQARSSPALSPRPASGYPALLFRRQRRLSREFQLSVSGWISAPRALIHYVAAQGQLPSTEAKGYYNVGYGRPYY